MATLRPFRQYDEHDVINMFAYDVDATATNGVVVTAGNLVKVTNGWKASDDIHDLTSTAPNAGGDLGLAGRALSLRYNLVAQVDSADGTAANEPILGMLLHDVRTLDENGEQLKFNPRKADEMQVVIPGQAVPIVTKGIFLLHQAAADGSLDAVTTAGVPLYATSTGDWADNSTTSGPVIGHSLGGWDADSGTILVKLELP